MTAPMSPEKAAWVREFAWLTEMRVARVDLVQRCRCQWGASLDCEGGRHGKCATGRGPVFEWETVIGAEHGFAEPYEHPTVVGPGARVLPDVPVHVSTPFVWLADRVCRWTCSCPCHGRPRVSAPAVVQLDLFAEAAA